MFGLVSTKHLHSVQLLENIVKKKSPFIILDSILPFSFCIWNCLDLLVWCLVPSLFLSSWDYILTANEFVLKQQNYFLVLTRSSRSTCNKAIWNQLKKSSWALFFFFFPDVSLYSAPTQKKSLPPQWTMFTHLKKKNFFWYVCTGCASFFIICAKIVYQSTIKFLELFAQ